jgi:transposase
MISSTFQRFLAIDLHKHYLVIGGVNSRQEVVLNPRRISLQKWPTWAKVNLLPTDAVVLEATTNAWDIYDQIVPLVDRVIVAHPPKVKWIAEARVKTDRHDVLRLAHLLAADLIPEVWVPPIEVRELRALMAYRRRLVQMGTRARNRLHSALHRHNLNPPPGKIFSQKHRKWWHKLDLSPTQRMHIRHDLATIDHVEQQLEEIEEELSRLSTAEPWADQVPFLLQLPGFGLIVTLTVLAAIGDISRFSHPKKLVGYAGLGASIHASGDKHRTGRIRRPVAKSCVGSWSKPPGAQLTLTPTGRPNTSVWNGASAPTRPRSLLPASCSWPSGMSSPSALQIAMPTLTKSLSSTSCGPGNLTM